MSNLFTDKKCHVCKKDLMPKSNSKVLADGFLDQDTNQNVCWSCRDEHYKLKSQTEFKGMFSEVPVLL